VWGSNYSDKVGVWGSNYSDKVGIWGSNYSDKVGIFSSNYSDKVGVWGSNYSDKVGIFSSNYSDKVGVWGSNYSDKVGIFSSNYSDKVGIYSSNYSDKVGIFSSNYSDKVGVWGSNYLARLDSNVSNYIVYTSNILANRIGTGGSSGTSLWTTTYDTGIYYTSNETKLKIINNYQQSLTSSPNPSTIGATSNYIYYIFSYTNETVASTRQTQYTIYVVPVGGITCDILIVGGGGAGGNMYGGGGGAGGVVYAVNITLPQGTYKINVGAGGTGLAAGDTRNSSYGSISTNQNGADSALMDSLGTSYISKTLGGVSQEMRGKGGGGGGIFKYQYIYPNSSYTYPVGDGGSGGGGGSSASGGVTTQGNTYWNGTAYIAGGKNGLILTGPNGEQGAGGGGIGDGYVGYSNDGINAFSIGIGGVAINITGIIPTPVYAAGGGTAQMSQLYGNYQTKPESGVGGSGIGGNGGIGVPGRTYYRVPTSGLNGTGSGGGGAGYTDATGTAGAAGNGGSGIVIIRSYTSTPSTSSIELINGTEGDNITDFKIGNYAGDFKIISSASGSNRDAFVINSYGNVGIGTTPPPGASTIKLNVNGNLSTTSLSTTSLSTTSLIVNGVSYSLSGGSDWTKVSATNTSNIYRTNNVGIGITNPGYLLEIGTGWAIPYSAIVVSSAYFYGGYTALNTTQRTWTDISVKVNGTIWLTNFGAFLSSSDSRIKEDIQDINDDGALQSILAIQPKTYKYIDKVVKGDIKVYGFIAQQIREVIPGATSLQKEYIPNIMLLADYTTKIITLPSQPMKVIIKNDDKIKCYGRDYKEIYVQVEEVIDGLTFKIKEQEKEYTDTKIFVCGTEIDDFHTLDKNYIYTLNVCATQELHRRIEAQNITIKAQEERINELETKMAQVLNHLSM